MITKKHLLAAALLLFTGCKGYDKWVPVSKTDTVPPVVTNIQVKDIPGGATISYSLPQSESLLYVMAQYSLRDSLNAEKKSSYYNNSITIEGFPDTIAHKVKLYSVSRGGKKSNPVIVTINPLTPPVTSVFNSLIVQPTFGGINISFKNETEANVKINVLTPDSLGNLNTADIFYTKLDSGDFSVRGFDSVKREFGLFVRDSWNNYSDTVFTEETPFYEMELDKTKFKAVDLPSDTYDEHCCGHGSGRINLWDGIWGMNTTILETNPGTGMPQWFTFDLGVKARLSRFKLYHRGTSGGTDGAYYAGDPKVFEIYGSNDPNPDGSWDGWTLLGHFTSVEPSGHATPTSDDIQFACIDGEDFSFPVNIPAVRYLRFKTLKTWGGTTYMYMAELTFWGSVK